MSRSIKVAKVRRKPFQSRRPTSRCGGVYPGARSKAFTHAKERAEAKAVLQRDLCELSAAIAGVAA